MPLNEQHTQQHSEASTLFLGLDVHKKFISVTIYNRHSYHSKAHVTIAIDVEPVRVDGYPLH